MVVPESFCLSTTPRMQFRDKLLIAVVFGFAIIMLRQSPPQALGGGDRGGGGGGGDEAMRRAVVTMAKSMAQMQKEIRQLAVQPQVGVLQAQQLAVPAAPVHITAAQPVPVSAVAAARSPPPAPVHVPAQPAIAALPPATGGSCACSGHYERKCGRTSTTVYPPRHPLPV